MDSKILLRKLPSVNDLLNLDKIEFWNQNHDLVEIKSAITQVLNETRRSILTNEFQNDIDIPYFENAIEKILRDNRVSELQPVVNATGVILHTNLGRAKLAIEAQESLALMSGHSTNLEYDITQGKRGDRYKVIGKLIHELTGAEDAIVVNNNAAAVMLVLSTLFNGKEVIISRGQLVEIGGSFRVPDIITSTGGVLKEIGTTNKTHIKDYEEAINEDTGGILLVHTSNYKLIGFTETPNSNELAKIAHKNDLPLVNDLGSGLMIDLNSYGLSEPTIKQEVENCDLVMFSGDKLLGGPQAGIIAGKKKYIDKLKHNQLLRALRVDKATLAALVATLKLYRDPKKAIKKIPVLRDLTISKAELQYKADTLKDRIDSDTNFSAEVINGTTVVGGGAFPDVKLPTLLIDLKSNISATKLNELLAYAKYPIIARISHENVLLDIRTIDESEFEKVISALNEIKN
ncbi:L-seryl-tRNA(Sec) selenium transferase [Companilactobacillus allii]|uniref:L-seryl-tRNA(Sec) selenium transferase n=1 Tax=Companilactobacillus allii TaxID=1847728 RepID=A0A1P8Q2U6_9LACO|nr:L-seryl-tRNA(Sec) selenium transferase [Companilactobacillus allii]APX72204.1 L-seryl-tRNA(Sec) selenium transferase [Companilactobacillus allii]USQ69299.1 L-seryl-tRNA(Sec) selenium transferase [Companilactobacillus allii]